MDMNQTLTPVKFPELLSPSKYKNTEIKSRLETIIKTIHTNHLKWCAAQKRGLSICNTIEAIKSRCLEPTTNKPSAEFSNYPAELKPQTDRLAIILTIFEDVSNATKEFVHQIDCLSKLNINPEEIYFRTWKLEHFKQFIHLISHKYEQEVEMKKIVTREIAHSKSKSECFLHSCVWKYPEYVGDNIDFKFKFFLQETKILFKV